MRKVTAPDGREWKVGRQWLPAAIRIHRRDVEGDTTAGVDGFFKGLGESFGVDDAGAGILVGFALLAVTALIFMVIFPIVALTIELMVLMVLFMGSLVGRLVLRRPWHVLARSGGARYRWPVGGWRASGERIDAVADSLASGTIPPGAEIV